LNNREKVKAPTTNNDNHNYYKDLEIKEEYDEKDGELNSVVATTIEETTSEATRRDLSSSAGGQLNKNHRTASLTNEKDEENEENFENTVHSETNSSTPDVKQGDKNTALDSKGRGAKTGTTVREHIATSGRKTETSGGFAVDEIQPRREKHVTKGTQTANTTQAEQYSAYTLTSSNTRRLVRRNLRKDKEGERERPAVPRGLTKQSNRIAGRCTADKLSLGSPRISDFESRNEQNSRLSAPEVREALQCRVRIVEEKTRKPTPKVDAPTANTASHTKNQRREEAAGEYLGQDIRKPSNSQKKGTPKVQLAQVGPFVTAQRSRTPEHSKQYTSVALSLHRSQRQTHSATKELKTAVRCTNAYTNTQLQLTKDNDQETRPIQEENTKLNRKFFRTSEAITSKDVGTTESRDKAKHPQKDTAIRTKTNLQNNHGRQKGLRKVNSDRTTTPTILTVLQHGPRYHTWINRPHNTSDKGVDTVQPKSTGPNKLISREKHRYNCEKGTLTTMILAPKGNDEGNGGEIVDMEVIDEHGNNRQEDPPEIETQITNEGEPSGLTDTVDLTKTSEEVTFSTNRVNETTDPRAFLHEEVTAYRKNNFPRNFINDGQQTIIDTDDDYYCHLTPMTVRIQSTKATKYQLERVLYSILLVLQHSDPIARIVEWDYASGEEISDLDQVRRCTDLTPSNMKKFIEEPRTNQKSFSFSGRICLLSELPLTEIKQDEKVRAWLNKERVYLTENNLDTATTTAVGLITGWVPRTMAEVHIARIRKEVALAPGFLVEYKWLSEGSNIKAKFITIRAAQRDVTKLVKVLMAQNGKSDFVFHPWDHIMSLSKDQKRHFIQSETSFQQKNYSLIIKNLNSGIDDIPMRYGETLNEKGKVVTAKQALTRQNKQQTVREFLLEHYRTWDGQKLFKTVHMEASGVIEVLVTEARFIEAKRCIEQIRQDMTCHMTAEASKASFEDYHLLQNRADSHILWTAIDLSGYAASVHNKREPTTPKRQRIDTSASTYSKVTKESTAQPSANNFVGGRYTPVSSVTTMLEPPIDKPWLELQTKNQELENKVIELEGLVKESQACMHVSIDNMMTSIIHTNTSRDKTMDDKLGELETLVKQSQSTTSSAIRALEKGVGTNDRVVQHLMTKVIPELQHDLQNTKSSIEKKMDKSDKKMDDGFSGIRNMFENMMNQHQGNSLHRTEGDNQVDVKKRNRSGSKSRKSDGDCKPERNRTENRSTRRSGDSRENDNLDDLTHSDHQMNGTGDQS
jgi:hypothetical protein